MIEMVGLQQAAKRRISGYSGGMKQRLGIAQALVHEPELIMLDEPVSALDPIGRREVMDLLDRLRGKSPFCSRPMCFMMRRKFAMT